MNALNKIQWNQIQNIVKLQILNKMQFFLMIAICGDVTLCNFVYMRVGILILATPR